MPLSEHEQRLLEEMERSLYQNDADFVAKVGRGGRPSYRSIVLGILLGVVGVACLLVGVFVQIAVIGIVGFVIMLGGVLLAIAPSRRGPRPTAEPASGNAQRAKAHQPGFMDKLNERWDKRQDGEH